ncbi:MAG: site-specific DNA-methyltransferase [Chloroflexi bacterium]|nr:site-specific DNA-methyltransferase [Chloroflexota bacterium]
MARKRPPSGDPDRVRDYRYEEAKRKNNPEVGLGKYEHALREQRRYEYDPHLSPTLVWAGKAERQSFEVPTVSLHIHERISTRAIIHAAERPEKQLSLFADPQLPMDKRVEFYQHEMNWANRLILGDSLLVANSLLQREGMVGKAQMIYVDPPYGISYSSNFQPTVHQRDVKDGQDASLTREVMQIKAFRDTWTLGIHSYLTYLRDRLLLCRDLLAESGSIFVQIGDENLHLVRALMDEVFQKENFVGVIVFRKSGSQTAEYIPGICDYLIWYAKRKDELKYRQLFVPKDLATSDEFQEVELPDGTRRRLTHGERMGYAPLPQGARVFKSTDLQSRTGSEASRQPFQFAGKVWHPREGGWRTNPSGLQRLAEAGRLLPERTALRYIQYLEDSPGSYLTNLWSDMMGQPERQFAVQTNTKVVQRCILMTTDPGDLVFDPTCGSGTTAYVAEQWGRRWITCDTSRVALTLARQRLLTATFPYYELAHPEEGVSSGFRYKMVPHITLKSIAQNEPPQQETLYDQPYVDRSKVRVSGPFTVEAIPAPTVDTPEEAAVPPKEEPVAVGPTADPAGSYISNMMELLRRDGLTFPQGKKLTLQNVRPLTSKVLHAEAEAQENGKSVRVAVFFGPPFGPVDANQVRQAIEAAEWHDRLIVAGYSFDSEVQAFLQKSPHPRLKT